MRKRVLQLIETSGPGGAETMLINLVRQLSQGGYDPIVCLRKNGWLSQQLVTKGFETLIVSQDGYANCTWFRRLRAIVGEQQINVIHAHEFAMNAYGCILSKLTGIPVITTVHGKNYYHERWRRRFAYQLVARWSKMVAVSEDIRNFLVNNVGIKEDQVTTIRNGIDVKAYAGGDDADRASKGRKGYVIGSVGSLYPVKGHTYLLKALAILVKSRPEVVCKIAGQGPLLTRLQAEAAELGISEQVIFLGLRNDIPQFLQDIDVFVLPSLSEGLPLSILEAMAAGKPVIATGVGGVSEVVQDQQTGFVVSPKDPQGLATRILQVMMDQSLARTLGRAARVKVERDFSIYTMTQQYQALYQKVCVEAG